MGAVAVLVAGGLRGTAVTHEVGDLVGGLRVTGPEIPLHVSIAQTIGSQTLLGVDKVRELNTVTQEEHRGVVAHDVVVAFLSVETQREAVDVTPGIRGTLLAGDGGEAAHHRSHGALLEELGLGISGYVLGNVQLAEGTVALSVRGALRHALAVEVCELLNKVDVIEHDRAVFTSGDAGVFRCNGLTGRAGGVLAARGALALIQNLVCNELV